MTEAVPGTGALRLRVVTCDGGETGDDRALSEAVGRLAGLAPAFEDPVGSEEDFDGLEAALRLAASSEEPVLVLPDRRTSRRSSSSSRGSSSSRPKTLRRILVPIDRSVAERSILRAWIARAQALGSAVAELHVLTDATRPAMWEGAGHHAAAWHDELRRRQLVGDASLAVKNGDPVEHLTAAEPRVDLVVSCWGGDPSRGRARILRRVLEASSVPVLLVRTPPAELPSRPRPAADLPSGARPARSRVEAPGDRRRAS